MNYELKIDIERGVAVVFGEEIPLARTIKPSDRGRWYVCADKIQPGATYDVVVLNEAGEIILAWRGTYKPYMFAYKVTLKWAAKRKALQSMHISERHIHEWKERKIES